MAARLSSPPRVRWLQGILAGGLLVAALTGVIALLDPHLPVLSLLVLYLLAVIPVALLWGGGPATVIAVLSTVVVAYFFLPPRGSIQVSKGTDVAALAIFVLTAVGVGNLAARQRLMARDSTRLSEEQAALRRVATLVAEGVPSPTVFEAVTREIGMLCGADLARMERYDEDGAVTGVAAWSRVPVRLAVGTRFDLEGPSIARQVRETKGPVRVGSFAGATGSIAAEAQDLGIRSSVGCPIIVEGHLWGVIAASSKTERPFPDGTESQITTFTELVATAIANAQSRVELNQLALEQAALRRVATLVAMGAAPQTVFTAATDEVARLLEVDATLLMRFEPDAVALIAGSGWSGDGIQLGERVDAARTAAAKDRRVGPWDVADLSATSTLAKQLGREGIVAGIANGITVEGQVWGALGVGSRSGGLAADTGQRLAGFTDLVATAITNAQARAELRRIAEEQAALRRVATLAARGEEPGPVFAAVAAEVHTLMGADFTSILRFEADGTATYMGVSGWPEDDGRKPGARWTPPLGSSLLATVQQTGRPTRLDFSQGTDDDSEVTAFVKKEGIHSVVGSPILVGGRLWGMITIAARLRPLPADTEQRMADFTEIIATAIANTESRSELAASRARVMAAADATRRRLERDLHDGAQQRLVSLALELRNAQGAAAEVPGLSADMDRMAQDLTEVLDELRELSRGIHPAILSEGGLGPALRTLARRSGVPVDLDIRTQTRFPESVEVGAYYVVSEALTNTTKYAAASQAEVLLEERADNLQLRVRDDGVGGADSQRGTGLTGMRDRVEALGGMIHVSSPIGDGTIIEVSFPLKAE